MTNLDSINEKKYYYDEKSANRAVDFIETFCLHTKGDLAGQPFILEEWQKNDIIKPLFLLRVNQSFINRTFKCYDFTMATSKSLKLIYKKKRTVFSFYN